MCSSGSVLLILNGPGESPSALLNHAKWSYMRRATVFEMLLGEVFCMLRRASMRKEYTTKRVTNIVAFFYLYQLHFCMLSTRYKLITISDSTDKK